jgi:hypothetical protein
MHEAASLSAQERQRIIDEFVDHAFAGLAPDAPGAHIARSMRQMPARLPDDPPGEPAEQVDAWVELAGLVADESFRQRVRQMTTAGATGGRQPQEVDSERVVEHIGGAVSAGIAPDSAEGQAVLGRVIDAGMPAERRAGLADELETFTDRRVERYWQLMGIINGRPPFPLHAPTYEWFIAALRASTR